MPKITITHGEARAVYHDALLPIFQALGKVEIARASQVEYNHATGQWEARRESTGELIAHGPNRARVIEAEIQFLEAELCRTQYAQKSS